MNKIERLGRVLAKKYGLPKGQWSLWCKRPKSEKEREEVMIGAILTQRTNWRNAELALANLKKAGIESLENICGTKNKKLEILIKPAGFYKAKADYLFRLADFVVKNYGKVAKMKKEELRRLRGKLLELKGIGPETADSILLYALDKPIFVVDEYTRRLVKKLKIAKNLNYEFLQKLFEKNLPRNFRLYQDFHALIVINGKNSRK